MKLALAEKPREFKVGIERTTTLKDMGSIYLEANEQITFMTSEQQEYDICRKEWGYYATPSINDRLKRFGFKTALVKNNKEQRYIMLVQLSKIEEFIQYLKADKNELVCWLDEDLTKSGVSCDYQQYRICPICKSSGIQLIKLYTSRPEGENIFQIEKYFRELYQCKMCDHLFNLHNFNFDKLYSGDYCQQVYENKLKENFEKIIKFPKEKSDNYWRVQRVIQFMNNEITGSKEKISVLDVGSGLCVFLYELQQKTKWECLAMDMDPRQAKHAQETCGIPAITSSILDYEPTKNFTLITLNKVLEHFKDPLNVLRKIKSFFTTEKTGYLYIEVPDGEIAVLETPDREEFFIEHYHAFSYQSLQMLLKEAGWSILSQARIKEPSGKYTIYSIVRPT